MIKMKYKIWMLLLVALFSTLPAAGITRAQEDIPEGPIYILQEGDTLWEIALRFGVPWQDLARANNIRDPGQLNAGDEIIIPGIPGIGDVLTTNQVPLGENLRSLSRKLQIAEESLVKLNHLTSQSELFNGYNLVVPESSLQSLPVERYSLAVGKSMLEFAASNGLNPWSMVFQNQLEGNWAVVPGDVLLMPNPDALPGPGGLPGEILALELSPLPLVQGKTTVIQLDAIEGMEITGSMIDHQLNFFQVQG